MKNEMTSRSLLLFCALASSGLVAQANEPTDPESPEDLRDFVASFNLGRPKDFAPLLVEDLLCAKELSAENTLVADAFPPLPDARLSKAALMSADKPKLRQFRQTLAAVVARRKALDVKAAATASTRFGSQFRELGQSILALVADLDVALKTDAPGAYFKAARRVRQNADVLDETFEHSYRAFKHLNYEYATITALSHGKPRPVWTEPKPHVSEDGRGSSPDVQIS